MLVQTNWLTLPEAFTKWQSTAKYSATWMQTLHINLDLMPRSGGYESLNRLRPLYISTEVKLRSVGHESLNNEQNHHISPDVRVSHKGQWTFTTVIPWGYSSTFLHPMQTIWQGGDPAV